MGYLDDLLATKSIEDQVRYWKSAVLAGTVMETAELTHKGGAVELPTGAVGILPVFVQVLLDKPWQGQTGIPQPGETLRKWITSTSKWKAWMTHESEPGVPDWLWLDLALPQISSLQDKTKEALPRLLAPYHAALTETQRHAFVGALVAGEANPAMKGRPLSYPWIAETRYDGAHKNSSTSDLRAPEQTLPMLTRLGSDPAWAAALQAHAQPLVALFQRWAAHPSWGHEADRKRHLLTLNALVALRPALRAGMGPDWVRWSLTAWPLPDPPGKFGDAFPGLVAHWHQVLTELPTAQVQAHLSPEALAQLDAHPQLHHVRQVRARQDQLAARPATGVPSRPRYRS